MGSEPKKVLYSYQRVPKVPDPEKATSREVMRFAGYNAFEEYFSNALKTNLSKRYPEPIVQEILNRVNSNEIVIFNKGLFYSYKGNIEDIDCLPFEKGVTIERYLRDIVFEIKRQLSFGADRIVLTSFLVNVAHILKSMQRDQTRIDDIFSLMNNFVLSVASIGEESPIYIRILDDKLLKAISEDCDINMYRLAVKLYFNAMTKVFDTRQKTAVEVPKIEYLRAVYNEREYSFLKSVEKEFKVPFNVIEECLEDVDVLVHSTQLEVALLRIKSMSPVDNDVDVGEMIEKIYENTIPEDFEILVNSKESIAENEFSAIKFYASTNKTKGRQKFLNVDFFRDTKFGVYSNVFINCTNYKNFNDLEPAIDCAHRLNMSRLAFCGDRSKICPVLKITLLKCRLFSSWDIEKIKEKLKKLRSNSNKDVIIEFQYMAELVTARKEFKKMSDDEYVRVISDIHTDINAEEHYVYNFRNDFVVNCGDTSGDASTTATWVLNNMRRGVFVHGNHLGYSGNLTLNESINYLEKTFPENSPVRYLNNSVCEHNGIIFIGCCLYTNFKLYGEDKQDISMITAARGMNDFYYPKYEDERGVIRRLTPDDYERFFIESRLFLKEKLLEYKNKPVVIVTHFAPIKEAIGEEFLGSSLNPAFVVDMTDLMDKYTNIRLWCFGHIHSRSDFIYNKTRVVAEPFGYYIERNGIGTHKYGCRIKVSDIKSMQPWETLISKRGGIKIIR